VWTPSQVVTITATDAQGDQTSVTFSLVVKLVRPETTLLDPTFGDGGIVTTPFLTGPDQTGLDVGAVAYQATQGGGKIVVASTIAENQLVGYMEGDYGDEGPIPIYDWNYDILVARYNENGTLDTTFGVNGFTKVDYSPLNDEIARGVAIDSEGRIIIVGQEGTPGNLDMAVVRLTSEGVVEFLQSIDTPTHWANAVGVTIDDFDRIVVAGDIANSTTGETDLAVARLNEAGALDFVQTIDFGGSEWGYDVQLDSQQRIVAVGTNYGNSANIHGKYIAVRLTDAGALDNSFGPANDGKFSFDLTGPSGIYYHSASVAIDSADRVIIGGTWWQGPTSSGATGDDFAVTRLTSSGILDASFGVGGHQTIDFGANDVARSIALDDSDQILIGGFVQLLPEGTNDVGIARLTPSGELDATFGIQTIDFNGGGDDRPWTVFADPLGRIIVGGIAINNNSPDPWQLALARLTGSNHAPTISASQGSVVVDQLATAVNGGAFSDVDGDDVTLTASAGAVVDNGDGTWSWSMETSGPHESQLVTITASDSHSAQTTISFTLAVRLPPVSSPEELAQIVENIPPGATEVRAETTTETLDSYIETIADLPANTGGPVFDIVLNLAEGDYQEPNVIDVPAGYRVIINGSSGQVIFHGNSPSLIIASGEVIVTGVTFVNATDAPTILVTGGSLVLRDSVVEETTAGNRAGIEITGGSVDLGTAADPGGNNIEVHGAGQLVRNLGGQFVAALGNSFDVDGAPLAMTSAIEARVHHGLDVAGLGIVGFADNGLFVTVNNGSVAGNAGAVVENTGAFGSFGANTASLSASLGNVVLTGDGSWKWAYQTPSGAALDQPIVITATDSDGNSTTMTFQLVVTTAVAGVTLDGSVLTVLGSDTAADVVTISRLLNNIVVVSTIGGLKSFPVSAVTEIRINTRGGNDIVATLPNVTMPMAIDGGAGNDVLAGGAGPNTIRGGAGNDLLYGSDGADVILGGDGDDLVFGGAGRDFLIGGDGADTILGNADDDLLVSGTTDFDANAAALAGIIAEWNSSRSYAQRTANIGGTGSGTGFAARLNSQYFLNANGHHGPVTVHDDNDVDTLTGDADRDWFFANLVLDTGDDADRKDKITDLKSNESAIDLDYLFAT
jgi:uncharacterized delta-60 repeat protein